MFLAKIKLMSHSYIVNFLSEDQTFSYIAFNLLVWWFMPIQATDILQMWVTKNVFHWRRLMGLLQVKMSAGKKASYWNITFNDRGLVVTTEYEVCFAVWVYSSFLLLDRKKKLSLETAWRAPLLPSFIAALPSFERPFWQRQPHIWNFGQLLCQTVGRELTSSPKDEEFCCSNRGATINAISHMCSFPAVTTCNICCEKKGFI